MVMVTHSTVIKFIFMTNRVASDTLHARSYMNWSHSSIWFISCWNLFPRDELTISQQSVRNRLALNGRQVIVFTNDGLVYRRKYESCALHELHVALKWNEFPDALRSIVFENWHCFTPVTFFVSCRIFGQRRIGMNWQSHRYERCNLEYVHVS